MRDRVSGRGQAHPLMTEQLSGGGLGHARDIASIGQPSPDLSLVVDPSDVIGLPVGRFDRGGQAVRSPSYRQSLGELPGYDSTSAGVLHHVS